MRADRSSSGHISRRRRPFRFAGATCAALGMIVLVACSDDNGGGSTDRATVTTAAASATTTAAPATTAAPVTTDAAAPTTSEAAPETTVAKAAVSAEALAWALEYTGATAGAASGDPVVIGVADFAEYPADPYTSAMADFINAELGGIDGHPIEIVSCDGESDAAGCAEQLSSNPDVVAVLENLYFPYKTEFHDAVASRKPILTIDPDRGTQDVSFFSGGLQALSATGLAAAALLPEGANRIAVVGGPGADVVIGTAVHEVAPDAEIVLVPIPDSTDDAPRDAKALAAIVEAAGAADVDVVIGYRFEVCDIATPAWEQLGAQPVFVWPTWCDRPDGIVVGDQVDFADPDLDSGELTVVEAVAAQLASPTDLTAQSGSLLWSPASLLLLVRVLNEVGVDSAVSDIQAHWLPTTGRRRSASATPIARSFRRLSSRQRAPARR